MEEPKRLLKLKHYKGMPIPVSVLVTNRVPDFASIHVVKAQELGHSNKCTLCGKGMQKEFAFVGGELSIDSGYFNDGPMHEECARYSFFVCPFVSGDHRVYRENQKEHEGMEVRSVPIREVKRMGILMVSAFTCNDKHGFDHTWIVQPEWALRVMWEEEIRAEGSHEGSSE